MGKAERINLTDIKNKVIRQNLSVYGKIGIKAMKEIRTTIVDEWFGEFNSTSMNAATKYTYYPSYHSDGTASIYINSYVDTEAYKKKPKAQKWMNDYYHGDKGGGSSGGKLWKTSEEYVFRLQLVEGIIGLPEKSTYRDIGWVNDHFVKRETGLRTYIRDHPMWGQFQSLVNKYK